MGDTIVRPVRTETAKAETRKQLEQQRAAIREAGAADRAAAAESDLSIAAKGVGGPVLVGAAALVSAPLALLVGGAALLTGCPMPIDPPASEGEGEGEGEGEPVQTGGTPLKDLNVKNVVVDESGNEVVIGSGEFYVGERPGIESDLRVNCGFDFPKMENQDSFSLIQGITPDQVPAKYDNNVKYVTMGLDGEVAERVTVDDHADDPKLGTKTYSVYGNPPEDLTLMPDGKAFFTNVAYVRADASNPDYVPNPALGTGKFGDPALVIDAAPEVQAQFFLWSGYAFRGNYNNPADGSVRRIYTQTINKDFATNTPAPEEGRYINAYQNCISTIPFSTDSGSTYPGLIGYRPDAASAVILKNPVAYQASFVNDNLILNLLEKPMEDSPAGFPAITESAIADIPAATISGVPKLFWVTESLDTMPNGWAGGKTGLVGVTKDGSGYMHFANILVVSISPVGAGYVPGAKSFDQNTKVVDAAVEPVTP